MKSLFGKQQYLYIALAVIGMCFAGVSLVSAQEPRPSTAAAVITNTSATTSVRSNSGSVRTDIKVNTAIRASSTATSTEARKAERQDAIAKMRAEIEMRKSERQAHLSDIVQKRIAGLGGTLTVRLQSAIERLIGIIERIDTHIMKLEAEGRAQVEARTHVDAAKDKLDEASLLVADINVEVEYTVTAPDPKTEWQKARAQFVEVREAIQEAHGHLKQAVSALRDPARIDANASTTIETTSN